MGWATHNAWFVDPDDREPYWTEYHRRRDDAQDAWATELAAGEGACLLPHSDPCNPCDLPAPAVPGLAAGAPTRSQGRRWTR